MKKKLLGLFIFVLTLFMTFTLSGCAFLKGKDGTDGKSAYQIWLDAGNVGTEADFLAWIKGDNENLQYQRISGKDEYRVIGLGNISELDIVIPSTYKGLPVTSIGSRAFENCSYVTSITISDSVTEIGDRAFSSCTSLTSIVIPDSVTSIGDGAFSSCTSLGICCEAESQPSGWDNDWYSNRPVVWSYGGECGVTAEGFKWYKLKDGNVVIGYEGNHTTLEIPSSIQGYRVTSIREYAFYDCTSLTSIVIPDSVTSIGDWVFYGCTSLTSVTMGNGVQSIGGAAFQSCTSLTSIEIPDSVTSIGSGAFYYCYNLRTINFNGTRTQWYNISKGDFWNYDISATYITCTDGTVSF